MTDDEAVERVREMAGGDWEDAERRALLAVLALAERTLEAERERDARARGRREALEAAANAVERHLIRRFSGGPLAAHNAASECWHLLRTLITDTEETDA